MKFTTTSDIDEFATRVLPTLHEDPVRSTIILSIIDGVQRGTYEEYRLGCAVADDGDVVGVAVRTPPRSMVVWAPTPEAVAALVDGTRDWDAPGVIGLTPDIDHVIAKVGTVEKSGGRRLFRLDELVPPAPAEGEPRYATQGDVELIAQWFNDFAVTIGEGDGSADRRQDAKRRVERGRVALWQRGDDVVSMVGRTEFLAGTARVAPVYTPEQYRGHGYASNLVAKVSADIQRAGRVPVLFTELSNPTSNKIYQAVGYRPVADSFEGRFA